MWSSSGMKGGIYDAVKQMMVTGGGYHTGSDTASTTLTNTECQADF